MLSNIIFIKIIFFSWYGTNLENAYVFCDIGERLANPVGEEWGCERCAFVNSQSLQLKSIHCHERSVIRNFICQKSIFFLWLINIPSHF
jgi:hypothetical protein